MVSYPTRSRWRERTKYLNNTHVYLKTLVVVGFDSTIHLYWVQSSFSDKMSSCTDFKKVLFHWNHACFYRSIWPLVSDSKGPKGKTNKLLSLSSPGVSFSIGAQKLCHLSVEKPNGYLPIVHTSSEIVKPRVSSIILSPVLMISLLELIHVMLQNKPLYLSSWPLADWGRQQ